MLENHGEQARVRIFGMDQAELQERVSLMLTQTMNNARKIKKIVEELKDFARQGTSELNQMIELNQLLETTVSLASNTLKKSSDRFSVAFCNSPVYVLGNFQKLEQVLLNALINACEALEHKNQAIHLGLELVNQKTARILIRDQGRGIPAQDLQKVFDPFFSTKRDQGGTGLGLSVSLGIIKDHKGKIDFESQPGEGSLCTITLPVFSTGEA